MNLKRLEISGFKSFRDKVTIDFSKGITGIVGPNGCGKSNIVDAIRWVMGEQRVKALRGKKMDDVVFNGSQDSAAVSMAEVTMTLVANGYQFPGNYADASEVSITRRVVLEGESEYYINKVPCRLLDVREFFMGTGVGARTYSLIEQGQVASLVEAKPEDRRLFIEDAAGVSKYKSRKEAAVRKMEATKQNLLRLNDILKEVKTQLNNISRQAKRAEQFKQISQQSREAELTLALQNYVDLSARETALEKQRLDLQGQSSVILANIESRESVVNELKTQLMELEEQISVSQQELYEIKNAISLKEKNIEFARHQIAAADERKQKNFSEIELWRVKKNDLLAEAEHLRNISVETESKIESLLKERGELEQHLQRLIQADRDVGNQLEEKKVVFIDLMMEKAKLKNMVSSLEKDLEELNRREERERREQEEDKTLLTDLLTQRESVSHQLQRDDEQIRTLKQRKAQAEEDIERSQEELRINEEQISQIKEDLNVKSSRLASLREFQETYKWCNESVQTIIANEEHRGRFYGVVADHISVPREYETAVEAVLGEKLQYVVVKSQEDGVRAIDYLKSNRLGRSSFVSVDLRNYYAKTYSEEHLIEAEPLLDKVKVNDDYRPIVDCLLGDVLLIPNIENGISLWKRNGFRGTFVTPEGDIISPNGVLTGGSKTAAEKSLLAIKREIGDLEEDVAKLHASLRERTNRKNEWVSAIARAEEEAENLTADIHALEIAVSMKTKDLERFAAEIERLNQRIAVLEYNGQNLQHEKLEAEEKLRALRSDIVEKEALEAQINDSIVAFNVTREQAHEEILKQERLLTDKKVELASLEEKKEAYRQRWERLDHDLAAADHEMQVKEEDIIFCDKQIAEFQLTVENEQASLKDLYKNFAVQEQRLQDQKAEQNRAEAQIQSHEAEIRDVKGNLDGVRRQHNEAEIHYREVVLNKENLKRAIAEKYHDIDLAAMVSGFVRIDEEKEKELIELVEKNKQLLDAFGQVNLLALDEYEELEKRYHFLSAQIADLNTSLNILQRTITRINKISRARFAETFEAVNRCFKDVFAQIFPGGRGELVLTDENDLLETGVDIDVQAPGKRKQNVSLLSGGEKSLVAVALIFAILKYRPSPFLVLDEVDAALDDANTNLFNRLIQDVAQQSQVVLITHNKSTMEVADTLFGVTMQKQGISTLVSVSLN